MVSIFFFIYALDFREYVVLGINNRLLTSECTGDLDCSYKLKLNVEKITIHPNFNEGSYKNDIALIRLADEVEFSSMSILICFNYSMHELLIEIEIVEFTYINMQFHYGFSQNSLHQFAFHLHQT